MKAVRHVPVFEALSFGWQKTLEQFGFILSFMLVSFGAMIALAVIKAVLIAIIGESGLLNNLDSIARLFLGLVIAMAGLKATLLIVAGKKPNLDIIRKDLFKGNTFGNFVLASIIVDIITIVGYVLFIIPGVYLSLKYRFTLHGVVDKKLSFSDAMNRSSEITEGVKWELIVFSIICGLTNLVGLLCLGFGLLITVPMVEIAKVYVYKHLS